MGGPLDPHLARRIVTETQGCPLAIIELVGELTAAELSGAGLPPQPLPLSRRLEAHFLRQVRALPAATQTLLLVAAAEPSGDPRLITRAAARLGSPPAAAEPARAEGVIVMYPQARFRHPLIRSAVYAGASPAHRRRAHHALAAEMDPRRDADRRAWHLAAAAVGPDEAVAAELDRAAGRARARGGYSAAGALLARAAQLTPGESRWAERVLAAAHAHLAGGAPVRARLLLEQTAQISDPFQQAQVRRLQGLIRYALGQAQGTASILLDAARALQPFDAHLARATMLEALEAARVTGRFTATGESDLDICRAARAMPLPPGSPPGVADLLLDGTTALVLDGHAAAVPVLGPAIAGLLADQSDSADALLWLGIGCWAAGAVGDDTSLHELATRLEQRAREEGALGALSNGLLFLAMSELLTGSLAAVRAHFAERAEIMATVGRPSDVGELVVLAWRGRETEARAAAAAVTRYATEHGHGWMLAFADYARAVLELGLGNYRAALPSDPGNYREDPFLAIVGLPDLIEAASRCGERRGSRSHGRVRGPRAPRRHRDSAGASRRVASAAGRRHRRREALPRRDRAPVALPGKPAQGAGTPAVRGVASPPEAAPGRPLPAACGPRDVPADGSRRLRRARPGRTCSDRRARAQANQRDAPRPYPAGDPDRCPGLWGRHKRRDRRTVVPQREHRGLSPPQGLPEARPDITAAARPRAAGVDGTASPGHGDIPAPWADVTSARSCWLI